jgi:hypothetical protein
LWSPVAGSWFVVCPDAGRHAGVRGRERNRPARAGKMFFSGQGKDCAGVAGPIRPAARKKILTARSERSERPVALPAAPARLIKSGCAAGPATGDLRAGTPGTREAQESSVTPQPVWTGRGSRPADKRSSSAVIQWLPRAGGWAAVSRVAAAKPWRVRTSREV